MLKLDLGCGNNKNKSVDEFPFVGIDVREFEGVDLICDLRKPVWVFEGATPEYGEEFDDTTKWRIKDGVVDEIYASHFLEHLTGDERVLCLNEMYRVMKVGAKALVITPIWSHSCAYGDPTHKWPPMSEWYAPYANKEWRAGNAPHTDYTCDFDNGSGYGWEQWLAVKNEEYRQFALQHYINAARDLYVTFTKNR